MGFEQRKRDESDERVRRASSSSTQGSGVSQKRRWPIRRRDGSRGFFSMGVELEYKEGEKERKRRGIFVVLAMFFCGVLPGAPRPLLRWIKTRSHTRGDCLARLAYGTFGGSRSSSSGKRPSAVVRV